MEHWEVIGSHFIGPRLMEKDHILGSVLELPKALVAELKGSLLVSSWENNGLVITDIHSWWSLWAIGSVWVEGSLASTVSESKEFVFLWLLHESHSDSRKKTLTTLGLFFVHRCCVELLETLKPVCPDIVFHRPSTTEYFGMFPKMQMSGFHSRHSESALEWAEPRALTY